MSSSDQHASAGATVDSPRPGLTAVYQRVATALADHDAPEQLGIEEIQDLLALAGRLYADHREAGGTAGAFGPAEQEAGITPTAGAIVASAVLDAVSVEVFELGMWRTWGTAP